MLSDKEKQDIENELKITLNKCLYNTEWLVGEEKTMGEMKEEEILNYIVELIQNKVSSYS